VPKQGSFVGTGLALPRPVHDPNLVTLDDPAYGAASEVTPKFVSPSDPAAQWTGALRSAAFFAYADNYLIDVKFGIIMDIEASRADREGPAGSTETSDKAEGHLEQ
jgi:hypothetical protein